MLVHIAQEKRSSFAEFFSRPDGSMSDDDESRVEATRVDEFSILVDLLVENKNEKQLRIENQKKEAEIDEGFFYFLLETSAAYNL